MDSPSRDLRMRGSPVSREAASCAPDKADLTDGIVVKVAATSTRRLMKSSPFLEWPSRIIEDEGIHRNILAAMFLTGITLVALEAWTSKTELQELLVGHEHLSNELGKGLVDVGSVILFLLPAMALVESVDHMGGFAGITNYLVKRTRDKPGRLMPMICFLAFFLSSLIDNLTATIVCVKILQRVVPHRQQWRHSCGGLVVVSANAGGAWSPIGDVTTTMLWIQHKVSTIGIVQWLFLPSFVAAVIPLFGIWWQASRDCNSQEQKSEEAMLPTTRATSVVLGVGITCILAVDLSSLLFFIGVLMAVSTLESAGVLSRYALFMQRVCPEPTKLAAILGVSSAVVDNVPLVQASIEMFEEPMDAPLWQLVALAAGTGGSMLAVGSVAGVTLMGLEGVGFLWYTKKISLWALLGFGLALGTYQLLGGIYNSGWAPPGTAEMR
ncbi:Sodium/proton antiporter 1 (AtNHD1) (Na(+)/H(+) antiporter 1) [Durusdinium trenchii]|uniref:Sodium/proton antiporter 1 (AtNHD1) (Na(+)/H(+) antiporter 1) n=1 Tax=Durusdinium trenchii TaxID=1381693 RepID=A0ABP0PWH9_9DINO